MTIDEQILNAMARAFFASAWAGLQDEEDPDDPTQVNLSGKEIMDVMPTEIDPAARHAAKTLQFDLLRTNAWLQDLTALVDYIQYRVPHGGDRPRTPENIGHYLAMQAMGHGVGLLDAFGKAAYETIHVPYVEFGPHSLERDY